MNLTPIKRQFYKTEVKLGKHRVPLVMELLSVCSEALVTNDNCLSYFVTPEVVHAFISSLAEVKTYCSKLKF